MFNTLILLSLSNLSDEALGYQILDRYSFSNFLAYMLPVRFPMQRNSREENKQIKNGEQPEGWSKSKKRQKDTDAHWTKKNNKSFFGTKTIYLLMWSTIYPEVFAARCLSGSSRGTVQYPEYDPVLIIFSVSRHNGPAICFSEALASYRLGKKRSAQSGIQP